MSDPQGESPKNLGSPAHVILMTFLIFLVSQILIAPLFVELGHLFINSQAPINFDNSIPAQFFFILVAEGSAAWLAITLVKRRHLSLISIGLRRPAWRDLKWAAVGFGIFYLVLILAQIIINYIDPTLTNQKQNIGFNDINTSTKSLLAFISLVVLPPLGEEVLMRGYLFSGLRMLWRFWPAAVATSLFFGAAHLEFGSGGPLVWAAAIDTCLLSLVLCFLRVRSGALYAGMLVHMLNNLIAFSVLFK
jgi:membrane protease YdiL (CAAX protease family)